MPAIFGATKFQQLFRDAARLHVFKNDLARTSDFVNQKLHEILSLGEEVAKTNGRDYIQPWDLPLSRGLRESMKEFSCMESSLELKPILDQLATLPSFDLGYSEATLEIIPEVAGAIAVCLARIMKTIDPDMKSPQPEHWEKARAVFDTLV